MKHGVICNSVASNTIHEVSMNSIKQILAISCVGMLLINCPKSSSNNDEDLLLGLAFLSLNQPTFTEVTPGFTLKDGERAFFSPGPWGEAETKINIPGLERETAFDVSITLTEDDGYAYFTANAGRDLRIQTAIAMIRIEQGGIRELLIKRGDTSGVLPAASNSKPTESESFALSRGIKKDFCLEIHRKFKGSANPYEVEGHLIAWDKPCQNLSNFDKETYKWDVEGEIIEDINSVNDTDLITGIAGSTGVGYVTKNSIVNVSPYRNKFGAAGSFR